MKRVGKASLSFEDVYLNEHFTVCGKREKDGPLGTYFDVTFLDLYFYEKSFEKAESAMVYESIKGTLLKNNIEEDDVDLIIHGDLTNQISSTTYALKGYSFPSIGIFSACASFVEGLILASLMINSNCYHNILVACSSHNGTCERQYRNPTEYGGQVANTQTHTVSGAGCVLVSNKENVIKITKATVGRVFDSGLYSGQDLGTPMSIAAGEVLKEHLRDFKLSIDDYDLIVTGDLSKYGVEMFKNLLKLDGITLDKKYVDCGELIYQGLNNVGAGGSGAGCVSVVFLSYITSLFIDKTINNCLVIATGALLNPLRSFQKESMPVISHAICFERVRI